MATRGPNAGPRRAKRGARGACLFAASAVLAAMPACRTDSERSEAAVRSGEDASVRTAERGAHGAGPGMAPEPSRRGGGEARGGEGLAAEEAPLEQNGAGDPGTEAPGEADEGAEADEGGAAWGIDAEAARGGLRIREVRGEASTLLRPGDVIVSVGGRRVREPDELSRRLAAVDGGTLVLFEVRRAGQLRAVGMQDPGFEPPPRPTAPDATDRANAPPPRGRSPQVIVVAPTGQAPAAGGAVGGGFVAGGTDFFFGRPPAFSAPGVTEVPGATFAPPPGTPSFAAPQIPGVSQPPGFRANGPLGAPVPPSVTAPFSRQTGPGTPGFGAPRPDASPSFGARGGSAPGVSIGPASAPPPGASMPRMR